VLCVPVSDWGIEPVGDPYSVAVNSVWDRDALTDGVSKNDIELFPSVEVTVTEVVSVSVLSPENECDSEAKWLTVLVTVVESLEESVKDSLTTP
jgi:hypothetical protein